MPTWNSAKHLLAEWDGAATEIFVTALPLVQLPVVIDALAGLPDPEVMSFQDEALEGCEPFDAGWRARFESAPFRTCQHSLRSASGTERHLQVYLWIDVTKEALEVELVFWNDLTFPRGLERSECERRFAALVSLAEACRRGAPGAACLLAGEHNGPTEDLLERGDEFVVVW